MATICFVTGPTGSGKSFSIMPHEELDIKGLDPKQTIVVQALKTKNLSVPGWKKFYNSENNNFLQSRDPNEIAEVLKYANENKHITSVVLDDFNYVLQLMYMEKITLPGYDAFKKVGQGAHVIIDMLVSGLRDDLVVFILAHTEIEVIDGVKISKIKTVGRMVDNYLTLEGITDWVLFTDNLDKKEGTIFRFRTQGGAKDTCKSPYGAFEDKYIPNDLGYVLEKIQAYNS